jgi:hypothetical protein
MRVKMNPPPFTMRLWPAFVNGKTRICSVFGLFFQDLSQFPWFFLDFRLFCAAPPCTLRIRMQAARMLYKPKSGRRFL